MFLFVSLPIVKRAERPRPAQNSIACCCYRYGSVVGLIGGLLVAVIGSLLTGISWLARDVNLAAALHQIGGVLLCATVPLLLLGACCLDGLEVRQRKQHQSR